MRLSLIESSCAVKNTVLNRYVANDREYWAKIGPEIRAQMLESYKKNTQTRMETINQRIKEAVSQPTPSWDTVNKAYINSKKAIKAQGHTYNEEFPMLESLRKLSPKEKAERASIQNEYTDKIISTATRYANTSKLSAMIASSHHVTNRSTDAFLAESGEDGYEKSVKNAEIFLYGTDEEKIAFLESKFKKALDVYDTFTKNIYSDKEACKLLLENYDTFTYMSEFEKLKDLEDDFGIKFPDSEFMREVKAKAPALVGLALYKNLLSDVISPAYLEFDQKELYIYNSAVNMCSPASPDSKYDLIKIKDAMNNVFSPDKPNSGEVKEALMDPQNPFTIKLNELDAYKENADTLKDARKEMVKDNIEAQNFPEGAKFVGLDQVEMDKEKAIQEILAGKIVNVFDKKNNFLKNYSEYSPFTAIFDNQKDNDMRVDDMTPEQIKEAFINIQKEVNGATRTFMRSSQEFRDFRRAIDEIVNLDLEEIGTEIIIRDRMETVAQTAEKYLNLKQQPGTNITSNTEARISVANKVSTLMRVSLAMQAERKHNLDTVKVGSYEEFKNGLEENMHDEFEEEKEEYTKSGRKIYKISGVDKAVYKAIENRLHTDYETNYIDGEKAGDFLDDEVINMIEPDFYKNLENDSNILPPANEVKEEKAELGDKLVKEEKDPPSV